MGSLGVPSANIETLLRRKKILQATLSWLQSKDITCAHDSSWTACNRICMYITTHDEPLGRPVSKPKTPTSTRKKNVKAPPVDSNDTLRCLFTELPLELFCRILKQLDSGSLVSVSFTNKAHTNYCQRHFRHVFERHWNALGTKHFLDKYYSVNQNPWHVTSKSISFFKAKHNVRMMKRSKKQQKTSQDINKGLKALKIESKSIDARVMCTGSKSKYALAIRDYLSFNDREYNEMDAYDFIPSLRPLMEDFKKYIYNYILMMLRRITTKYIDTTTLTDEDKAIIDEIMKPVTSVELLRKTLKHFTTPFSELLNRLLIIPRDESTDFFSYFLHNIDHITNKAYIPTKSDLKKVPPHHLFEKNKACDLCVDVDGFNVKFTLLPRMDFKVIKILQKTANVVAFFVTLTDYSLPDNKFPTKLHRSAFNFKLLLDVVDMPVVLTFDTFDFEEMCEKKPFTTFFPDCQDDDVDNVNAHILSLFSEDGVHSSFFVNYFDGVSSRSCLRFNEIVQHVATFNHP